LTPRDANVGHLARCPIEEGVGHRGLADAGLSGDEHSLPFAVRHPSQTLVELGQRPITSDQDLRRTRHRSPSRRRALRDGGDEPVPSPGQRFDEYGLPCVVTEERSNVGDVALENLRLDVRLRPDSVEQLGMGHESSWVLDEITQHRERLRRD
jgi:hypothetical protein